MIEDEVFAGADTLGPDGCLDVVKSAQETVPQLLVLRGQLGTFV